MSAGRVLFVGCGPGAADLLTLRAVAAISSADVVIWSPSLLARADLDPHLRPETEVVAWPPATQDEILGVFDRARAHDLDVVRLKGGDPTLFGELEPELSAACERGLACEIVPGVSAAGAAAAALGSELGRRGAPLLLVHAADLAREPAQPSLAVYGIGRDPRALQQALRDRGLAATTPCSVAIELSRRDETVVSCQLDELAETIEDLGLGLLTLVLAGASPRARSAPAEVESSQASEPGRYSYPS